MKKTLAIILCSILVLPSCNKEDKVLDSNKASDEAIRYNGLVFKNIAVSNDIIYGRNKTKSGISIDLKMDIYQPVNDTIDSRPLIVLAHGGGFFGGDKSEFETLAFFLSQSGYVVASINYRLLDIIPNKENIQTTLIDAVHDMKAAVRFFYKNHTAYGIDTTNIFIGGYSAGAFTALHYAYLNSTEEAENFGGNTLADYINDNNGFEGNSGNEGYASVIKGVLNISGALGLTSFVNMNEPILFSVHGTADEVVPFLEGEADNSGVITQGSGLIHPEAERQGITNSLKTIIRGDHAVFFNNCSDCMSEMRTFIFNNL